MHHNLLKILLYLLKNFIIIIKYLKKITQTNYIKII